MKRRIITIVLTLSVVGAAGLYLLRNQTPSIVQAVGDLTINWGVPSGDPIFVVSNMLPGDTESRQVIVTNGATSPRDIAVRGDLLSETASFSSVLDFVISENGTDLYGGTSPTGPKTLANFFDETATPSSVPLSTINPSQSKTYTFSAHFQESAGNEFQNAHVIFNLVLGIDTEIPDECSEIEFSGPTIFGTDGDDTIRGTHGNDLIFALEGNDRVLAWSGDDCIVGGSGNDELRGETGDDIIFGNEGDDLVIGAVGRDLLFGNDGNDTMRGENNNDVMEGGAGNDTMLGGNSDDLMHGGDGNDTMLGENGEDSMFGDSGNDDMDGGNGNDDVDGGTGNDTLKGKNGSDTLIGGTDTDSANGYSGTDTCDAEVEVNCEL